MKKKIFSMLVLLMTAVTGAWADGERTSHWPDFNPYSGNFEINTTFVAGITIDGVIITTDYDGWDQLEVAAFVGDECRSAGEIPNYLTNEYVLEYGDPFPVLNGMNIFHNGDGGEALTFKMYNHATGVEYTTCTVTLNGEETPILTGEDHIEGWDDPDNPVFLNFTSPEPAEPETPAVPVTSVAKNEWQFTMPDYAVVAKIEYDTELALDEVDDNTAKLEEWHGYEADVTLTRTLVAGSWNTLAVPFNVSSTMLGHLTSTYGIQVKELTSTSLANEGKTLMLNFEDATEMVAGTPYLVKVSTDYDFSARALPNTEVSQELNPVTTTYADFIPTLGKTTIEGVDAENILFVAAGNKLLNPSALPADMKGFRAYFQLKGEAASQARAFSMNFGDSETAIEEIEDGRVKMENEAGAVYDLQGRSMESSAQRKGVYIVNGKKLVIK